MIPTYISKKKSEEKLTANPIDPKPKITTVEPGSTFAVFQAAPTPETNNINMMTWSSWIITCKHYIMRKLPVDTPQLKRHALLGGISGSIFVTLTTSTTVYSEKLDIYRKWCKVSPSALVNLLVSSLCSIEEGWNGNFEQRLLFLDLQSTQSIQSGKKIGTTESPSFNSSTSSPTLSTTLKFSKS